MRALWLVNQLWFIVPVNPWKNRASSELLYKSNRPQVSMVYRLINHLGCWQNIRRIRKSLVCGSWFTNSSRALPASRVVYQPITIETCGLLLKYVHLFILDVPFSIFFNLDGCITIKPKKIEILFNVRGSIITLLSDSFAQPSAKEHDQDRISVQVSTWKTNYVFTQSREHAWREHSDKVEEVSHWKRRCVMGK